MDHAERFVVDRRTPDVECGARIGTMAIKLKNTQRVEYVAFHCTKSISHRDACEFVGVELVVRRRRREDGR